jgi:uncharacterized protein YecE (DUF72 family)
VPGVIKIGISSWTERTLVESGWYPRGASDAESRLRYYASRFSLAEVDSTYYAAPSLHQAEVWAERTPPGFTMDVKAHAFFTAHYTDARRLPPDLRRALAPPLRDKARLYPKEVGDEVVRELARRFREALEPLRGSGKLGPILLQYPVWFPISSENRQRIAAARELLPGCRLAVEFRNATWLSERNRSETLALLHDHDLAYTCVDEPQGFVSSVPPIAVATSDLAYVRFHGRNARTWEARAPSAAIRMSYRYSRQELAEWVPRIERLAGSAREVHVVMNNCHRDYAVTNAAELAELLAAEAASVVAPTAQP